MKATRLFLLLITGAAAGCGVVNATPGQPTGDDQMGSGGGSSRADGGIDAGSDSGSGSGSGSGAGSGSGSHAPGVFYGSIFDERNDVIDFGSGVPVHTHAGVPIDLLDSACPDIYKYAYLESEQAPPFGSTTSPNPLAWHIISSVTQVDPAGTAYRVRDAANHVLLDWTLMTPDSDGIYTIDLHRDGGHGAPAIGTQVGKLYLDARFRSTNGSDTMVGTCWNNHPLAAPLQVASPTAGALFTMTFANHAPLSKIMNPGSFTTDQYGLDVASVKITQMTAEPANVSLAVAPPTGTGTVDIVNTEIGEGPYPDNYSCGATPCPSPGVVHTSSNGQIAGTWQLRVIDYASGTLLCRSTAGNRFALQCPLPARVAGAAAHPYLAILSLSAESSIAPPTLGGAYVDQLLGTKWFTGSSGVTSALRCSASHFASGTYLCTESSYFWPVSLANQASIAFDKISFTLETAPGDASTAMVPPNIGALDLAARTWSAGNDGF